MSVIEARSEAWHAERRKGIGGSEAGKIMAGDWYELWLLKTGRKEPDDLTWVLPVPIGIITEDLNRRWFEHHTGIDVSTFGCDHLVHPDLQFMRANLDGFCAGGIFEAKHTGAFSKPEEIVSRYYPQLQHNMLVAGVETAYLSVFFGTLKWEWFTVEADPEYQAELMAKEAEFWAHVEKDVEPENRAASTVSIALDDMREVVMTGSNEWASAAADWLENKAAAKRFDTASKRLKGLVEPDVKLAAGHGVQVKRSKNGSLSITEMK